MPNFTTGPAALPDVGQLIYNGCTFSSLFKSEVSGQVVKDNANRTTKWMEYTISVDGVVTLPDKLVGLPDGQGTTTSVMQQLRFLLTAQAGSLVYKGRGNDIIVNQPSSTVRDVAWGPIPELLDFQPLGAGRSAMVKWIVKTRICDVIPNSQIVGRVLQFNEETSVIYGEDGYSTLAIKGTLEIPLTRATQATRTLTQTADDFRQQFMTQIAASIDLTRFRVTKRDFNVTRDKRTLEWSFAAEELPPMGLPVKTTVARGSFSFRPAKTGMGLCTWLCTMRVTYTVRKDRPRRSAWIAFLSLLRIRMNASINGVIPAVNAPQNTQTIVLLPLLSNTPIVFSSNNTLTAEQRALQQVRASGTKAWLIDLNGEEGLYLDSKTVTFSASWRLITTLRGILAASGLWRYNPFDGGNNWRTSVSDISGWKSWLENDLDPAQDVIVDFGS